MVNTMYYEVTNLHLVNPDCSNCYAWVNRVDPDQIPQNAASYQSPGFKFNFFDSLLKLASGIIFYLLNLSANLLFHTYKHC